MKIAILIACLVSCGVDQSGDEALIQRSEQAIDELDLTPIGDGPRTNFCVTPEEGLPPVCCTTSGSYTCCCTTFFCSCSGPPTHPF